MPSPIKRPRWFTCLSCPDPAMCSEGCTDWEDPFESRQRYGVGGAMQVVHPIRIYVNDEEFTTEWPRLTVQEILSLAAEPGLKIKSLESGVVYIGFHHSILLRDGMRFVTPHYEQARDAESKL